MARIIRHNATGPIEVKPSAESVWVCMCGLSKNYPFCDGQHKLAKKQEVDGKVYSYTGDDAVEVAAAIETREL